MIYPPDLVFAPTLACEHWDFIVFFTGLTSKPRHAHSPRTVCLRGSFCPRLAWTCNHRHGYIMLLFQEVYLIQLSTGACGAY